MCEGAVGWGWGREANTRCCPRGLRRPRKSRLRPPGGRGRCAARGRRQRNAVAADVAAADAVVCADAAEGEPGPWLGFCVAQTEERAEE